MRRPLLPRSLLPACILLGLVASGCAVRSGGGERRPDMPTVAPADTLGVRTLYTYEPDSTASYLVARARPTPLSPGLSVKAALDSLGRELAAGYFRDYGGKPVEISFEALEVLTLPTPPDSMRIAVVDMVDPERAALRMFFQGATGGAISELMIRATLMQVPPTVGEKPLLDGLVLLHNGERIPFRDHVSFHYVQQPPASSALRTR